MTRALVTGAHGFVGRHLVDHLGAVGDDVIATDRSADGIDIADGAAVSAMIGREMPEVVYHLAGWSDVGGSWKHPEAAYIANVLGTDAVLRACADHGVSRVLVVTSADVYGAVAPESQPIDETAELRPQSPYAASKAAAEMAAIQAGLGRGLDVIRARAFNHVGPGQRVDFVVPALVERVLSAIDTGGSTVSVGALEPTRDFTDVRDIVKAYRLLIEHGRGGEAYNVCSGNEISIGALLEVIIEQSGGQLTSLTDPALLRPVDVPRRVGDPTKLRSQTGWHPAIPLAITLAEVVAERRDYRSQTDSLPNGD